MQSSAAPVNPPPHAAISPRDGETEWVPFPPKAISPETCINEWAFPLMDISPKRPLI